MNDTSRHGDDPRERTRREPDDDTPAGQDDDGASSGSTDDTPPVPLDGLSALAPPPELEDRLVGRLRAERLLTPAGRPAAFGGGGPPRRHALVPLGAGWLAAAAAAAVALFAGGYALGQTAGSRAAVQAFHALGAAEPSERAAALQRTGSLYVRAVTALEGSDPAAAGHEVALATLRAAATELARLSPDDARLARVLEILHEERAGGPDRPTRTLLWF